MSIRQLDDEGREIWGDFELAIAGSTHTGRLRKTNQDAFDRFDDPDRGEILLVVADGLGGHQGGATASKMAIGTLGKLIRDGDGDSSTRLKCAIERANFEIHELAGRDRTLEGMGTTVVALMLCERGSSFVAHVGDTRLYRLRGGEFEALTEDHSIVALLLRRGDIRRDEARDHPKQNQITQAVGVSDEVETEITSIDIKPGDTFLLCSDGLHGMLSDSELKLLSGRSPDAHAVVAWMIDAANQAGGKDNVTAMIAKIHDHADPDG